MVVLLIWLNEYYPKLSFPKDVFQTWNPHERPDDIIKECHFLRVVHTKETPKILAKIDKLQGRDHIYYAGAYSMEGMGLLEQAARSGEKVARLINLDTKKGNKSFAKKSMKSNKVSGLKHRHGKKKKTSSQFLVEASEVLDHHAGTSDSTASSSVYKQQKE